LKKGKEALENIRGKLKMKTIKTTTCLGIAIITLSSIILLLSCTSGIGTVTDVLQQTNTSETTTVQTEPSVTPTHTSSTTTTETATPTTTTTTTTTTEAAPTTTAVTTTAVEQKDVYTPVVGTEFAMIPLSYDKWTVLQFDYDVIHEPGDDYHFPWSLTIKNKTETDLKLTAYIIHWGFHGWVGHVSETPFTLKAGETMSLSGEDIMTEAWRNDVVFLEDILIEVYIAEG
jgi:hypothetical protein